MYRRRRIVVALALALAIAVVVFCCYSLTRGASAIGTLINHDDIYAISREEVPEAKQSSGTKDCTAQNVSLQLTAQSQTVAVGGALEFSASIVHEGSGSCLIDGSDSSRVLTITSGEETIWRSDVCAADPRMLLMAKGDKDIQTITWNTNANATLTECTDEADWSTVNPGTYVARLSLKDVPDATSDQVVFTVQ
ncbi:hypothetical protein [Bifidobacterium lemurum]|nr:hypothetical protein [Bifidobacterium lemurum]QOL35333.1 hypothetical protein BL8807_01695 [Bifidobacterium lemurum]